jgi:hypothetical protein
MFLSNLCWSQDLVKGRVLGAINNEPLAYCSIQIKGTSIATISNATGDFTIPAKVNKDTIVFSFISYHRIEFLVDSSCQTFLLNPKPFIIDEVKVVAKYDEGFVYDLLHRIKKIELKKSRKSKNCKSFIRAYSLKNQSPKEFLEAYYSLNVSNNTIDSIHIKNGRYAIPIDNKDFFLSIDILSLIGEIEFFTNFLDQDFFDTPFKTSKKAVKNDYEITTDLIADQVRKINYVQRNNPNCNGYIIYDFGIEKPLELLLNNHTLSNTLIKPINYSHKVSNMQRSLKVGFNDIGLIMYAALELSYDYSVFTDTSHIQSYSLLTNFDFEESFSPVLFSQELFFLNDYERIVSIPFDSIFWKNAPQIPPTQNEKSVISFLESIETYGNAFNESNQKLFSGELIYWKSNLVWADISDASKDLFIDNVRYSDKQNSKSKNIECSLILNFNSYSKEDSLPIPVFAVINSENTFCQTERTKNSLIYFQTYFNIYQKHAKFLESKINSVSTSSEVIHLFNNQKKRLAKEIWKFKSDTQEGKYISTLNEWNISTKAELQKYGK